jgi:hypothetical protein
VLGFEADVNEERGLFQQNINPDEFLSLSSPRKFYMYISNIGNIEW